MSDKNEEEVEVKIGFEIEAGRFNKLLKVMKCSGTSDKGKTVDWFEDAVITVRDGEIYAQGADFSERQSLAFFVTQKVKTFEQGQIPIVINSLESKVSRFNSNDLITVFLSDVGGFKYITLYRPKSERKGELSFFVRTKGVEKVVSFFGDRDLGYVVEEENHRVVNEEKDRLLDWHIKVDASELKEVVKDGEQIKKRIFPFQISTDLINVRVENIDNLDFIDREIPHIELHYPDGDTDIQAVYSTGFGNAFGSALTGIIDIYLQQEDNLYIRKQVDEDCFFDYMIVPFKDTSKKEDEKQSGEETEEDIEQEFDEEVKAAAEEDEEDELELDSD
jgi:hypothetical protein